MGTSRGPPWGAVFLFVLLPCPSFVFLQFCLCAPCSAHLGTGAAPPERCPALFCAPFSFSFFCSRVCLVFASSNLPICGRLSGACSAPGRCPGCVRF